MKDYIITLDTGTTNTRAVLWHRDGRWIRTEKCEAGVRDTAVDGSNERLKRKVSECLRRLTEEEKISFEEVEGIFASGMITSNVGLLEVPHLTAPASLKDFVNGIHKARLLDVCPVPFYFIRGLKNRPKEGEQLKDLDIMRGEEAETLALLEMYPENRPYVFILPGSHSKFVFVDEEQKIRGCVTSLTGELLETLTLHTILADAVGRQFAAKDTYYKEAVLSGYHAAKEQGAGRAMFLTRIYKMFGTKDQRTSEWAASYLLGVVLESDAAAIKGSGLLADTEHTVGVVAGKEPFLSGLVDVLNEEGLFLEVIKREPFDGPPLSALGAFLIARNWMEAGNGKRD